MDRGANAQIYKSDIDRVTTMKHRLCFDRLRIEDRRVEIRAITRREAPRFGSFLRNVMEVGNWLRTDKIYGFEM